MVPPMRAKVLGLQSLLPNIIFVAGKKLAGKDFLCDVLVKEAGFHKYHIVYPWLLEFCKRNGITWEEYEATKAKWREKIQEEGTEARKDNPDVLVDSFRKLLPSLPRPLCVTAVRFKNESRLGYEVGAMVVRVQCSDVVRKERFVAAGESLDMFNDPFESEVDTMPVQFDVSGTLSADEYIPFLSKAYFMLRVDNASRIS